MNLSKYLAVFLLNWFCLQSTQSQDSTYIYDYSDKLILRIYTINKFNSLSIKNKTTKQELKFLPNGSTNIGIGYNYKKFGIGIAFGLPPSSENERKFGKTKRFDLQASMYGRKIGADGFFQKYKGYYNSNPDDFFDWTSDVLPQLNSMTLLSAGLSSFYVFNYEKYSYRAAFVRDELQKKSAGSFLLGVFGIYDDGTTEDGFIPNEFPDNIETDFDIKKFKNLAIGISVGYAYNLVITEKILFGAAVIPGFGYQRVSIRDIENNVESDDQPAGQLLARFALGYEHRLFFLNFTGSVNFRTIDLSPHDFNLSTEQFRFIIGKRF